MGWYTLIQIILQFVTHLFLPGYLLYDLWKQPGVSRFKWLVKGIHHSSYVFYIFLAGRWDIPGYYLRYTFKYSCSPRQCGEYVRRGRRTDAF